MKEHTNCWCGNENLLNYSPKYSRCATCGSLVLRHWPNGDMSRVQDSGELYSQDYYLKHLPTEYDYPSLKERARADLSERVLFWTETLLRYKLPPAKVLELGSAHGGFVAILRLAGFDATGLELSPWLVQYAKETFDVPMYQGPLEDQEIPPGSLDAVVLMDVLEHLPDPLGTMHLALELLAPNGILLIQTPQFPEKKSFDELEEIKDPFLAQFKEKEHLFLFSPRAVEQLFTQLGYPTIVYEPAIFAHYDMFFVVGKSSTSQNSPEDIDLALQRTSSGRIAQAYLDTYKRDLLHLSQYHDAKAQLQEAHVQLQEADQRLREAYAELQIARQALWGLQNSRFYKTLRHFGVWAWMDSLLNQVKH